MPIVQRPEAGVAGEPRELADALEDHLFQFRILSHLHSYCRRAGHFHRLLDIAQRAHAVGMKMNHQTVIGAANSKA
jgi:hypothetical protein